MTSGSQKLSAEDSGRYKRTPRRNEAATHSGVRVNGPTFKTKFAAPKTANGDELPVD
jgi:hypothetical protein